MAYPTVAEKAKKDFEIARSSAFIALFTQTLDSSASASFVIRQPHTEFLPGHTLTVAEHEPVSLLYVPTDAGQVTGDYLITVSVARIVDGRVEMTCTITNTAPGARTDSWEVRGARDDVIVWELAFSDRSDRTRVDCVASDPRAELAAPEFHSDRDKLVITAVDPRGTPAEPTVLGTLPEGLQPRVSWMQCGGDAIAGLPACTDPAKLNLVLPAVGQPNSVSLQIRTTFGGICPLNTAYLENISEPVSIISGSSSSSA